jgi:hypothetical protein
LRMAAASREAEAPHGLPRRCAPRKDGFRRQRIEDGRQ